MNYDLRLPTSCTCTLYSSRVSYDVVGFAIGHDILVPDTLNLLLLGLHV